MAPPKLLHKPPADGRVISGPSGPGGLPTFFSRRWAGSSNHSHGMTYACPITCFAPPGCCNRTHFHGLTFSELGTRQLFCAM